MGPGVNEPDRLPPENVFRGVLEAVVRARTVASIDDLNETFRPVMQSFGFKLFVGVEIAQVQVASSIRVVFGEGYEPWWGYYRHMGYADSDPILGTLDRALDPFLWSDIVSTRTLSPAATQVMKDARAFGLHEGFVEPLHRSDGSIFMVLLAGQLREGTNIHLRAAMHLLASYYGMIGRQLNQPTLNFYPSKTSLTKRQLECLRWVREGKSSKDISTILGISDDVVDEHVARACKRLGVRTRMQAVANAMMKGYLSP